MARRPTKLEVHEDYVMCPYCRTDITACSLMEVILAARKICPHCEREMMIHDGKAVRSTVEGEKKPPKEVRMSHVESTEGIRKNAAFYFGSLYGVSAKKAAFVCESIVFWQFHAALRSCELPEIKVVQGFKIAEKC